MIENLDELYVALQNLVETASGVETVILADQGRPAPDGLYATYDPIPVRAVGHPRTSRDLVDATEDFNEEKLGKDWQDFEATTISQIELMVSCNFLNEGARDAAWRMHNAMFRWPVQEITHENGIAWRSNSEIRNLTALSQGGLQPRYQVDAHLWIEVGVTDQVLRANGFDFKIEDEAGNVLYDGG